MLQSSKGDISYMNIAKLNELIGQKFNKLTVLKACYEKRNNDKRARTYVTCQCECGNIKDYYLNNIKYGTTKSCGCKNAIKLDQLIGKKYGKLKILKAERRKHNKSTFVYVTCECECGSIKEYRFDSLKNGSATSCGCANKLNLNKLIGQKFGKLTIIDTMRKRNNHSTCTYVTCECDCGTIKDYQFSALKLGKIKSCGCTKKLDLNELIGQIFGNWTIIDAYYKKDNTGRKRIYTLCSYNNVKREIVYDSLKNYDINKVREKLIYDQTDKRLYHIYISMKTRCYNASSPQFQYYGARGIRICDIWLNDFNSFRNWALINNYQEGLTIDRIDVNGNYEPANCRWVNIKVQNNNKRTNNYITINHETKTLAQWCALYNMNYNIVHERIKRGNWEPLKALTTPVKLRKNSAKAANIKQQLYQQWCQLKRQMCNEWQSSFNEFFKWSINNGYSSSFQLQRVGGCEYNPTNSYWI